MPRRGSAYVSPVISSSSSSSSGDDAATVANRRRSQWQAWSSSSDSSSSSDFSSEDEAVAAGGDDTDALEDFVDRRKSGQSVAKLDRLRRIFLNKPPRAKRIRKPKGNGNQTETHSSTTSNSSCEHVVVDHKAKMKEDTEPKISLAIGHHVTALRDQVQRLARHHDAHTQQWQVMLTQAIDELTFTKQQEERALQSHVRLVQESYALRLEMFEQQYRAKVAEIREAMRAEIAQQRTQSEAAVVAAAQRLQQQTQKLFQSDDDTPSSLSADQQQTHTTDTPVLLIKTSAFLDRQRAREDTRRRRRAAEAPPNPIKMPQAETKVMLSPVTRQRAKLHALEQKLATFSPATVDRVLRNVEQRRRGQLSGSETIQPTQEESTPENSVQSTPLSPLRRRASCWRNGISREDPQGKELSPPPKRLLSRRFLLPAEEHEFRSLRNRIGLAKDWMDEHAAR